MTRMLMTVSVFLALGAAAGRTAARDPATIHSCYVVGGGLEDRAQVQQTRFSQYDFIYLFAGPPWKAEDMDEGRDRVLARVAEHAYPQQEKGNGLVPLFIEHAHRGETKVLIGMAGGDLPATVTDERRLANYVEFCKAFVRKYDYDGIEIDWEEKVDLRAHARLMKALRRGLDELGAEQGGRRYFLTTALHYWRRYDKELADALSREVDWINVMCYDMGGGIWGGYSQGRPTPGHNCPLDAMRLDMDAWLEVFDRRKLLIGLANYGFCYRGLAPGALGLRGNSLRGDERCRYIHWTEVDRLVEDGWREEFDRTARVSYYFSPDGRNFVTIDNHRSHDDKLDWIQDRGFRGVFWWHFQSDYRPARREERFTRHELIDHVTAEMDRRGMRPLDAAAGRRPRAE